MKISLFIFVRCQIKPEFNLFLDLCGARFFWKILVSTLCIINTYYPRKIIFKAARLLECDRYPWVIDFSIVDNFAPHITPQKKKKKISIDEILSLYKLNISFFHYYCLLWLNWNMTRSIWLENQMEQQVYIAYIYKWYMWSHSLPYLINVLVRQKVNTFGFLIIINLIMT